MICGRRLTRSSAAGRAGGRRSPCPVLTDCDVVGAQHLVGDRVMEDLPRLQVGRTNLDHPDPARLGERNVARRPVPHVLVLRRHRVLGRLDDEVGRAVAVPHALPLVGRRRAAWRGGRSFGSPCGAPPSTQRDDRVDLLVAERHVVLELLHADARVDVPRRHLPRGDALLDGARPRTGVLVGDERHRRDRVRLMALLALGLEDRRDVLRERRRFGCRSRRPQNEDHAHPDQARLKSASPVTRTHIAASWTSTVLKTLACCSLKFTRKSVW